MIWLPVIIAIFAFWHYLWDGILAPSLRAQYRFELFKLRDLAREMRCSGKLDRDRFAYLEDSINTAVHMLSSITVCGLVESRLAIENDPELRERIERRLALIEGAPDAESKELSRRVVATVYKAFVVNSGGWFAFVIPVAAIWWPIRTAYIVVQRLLALTENEVLRAAPYVLDTFEPRPQ